MINWLELELLAEMMVRQRNDPDLSRALAGQGSIGLRRMLARGPESTADLKAKENAFNDRRTAAVQRRAPRRAWFFWKRGQREAAEPSAAES